MPQKDPNTLFLTIKKKWFDEIATGKKKEEFREIKPFFDTRLSKPYKYVIFQNGYAPNAPRLLVEFNGIKKKKIDGVLCYAIQLGRVIKVSKYPVAP
ncbi:hypothetical protein QEG73_01825 [Chitinophagaceae bacterium 26-R-25]|nr:hypothetical protein [Chitinophagaceae bacterium 26-R-25]